MSTEVSMYSSAASGEWGNQQKRDTQKCVKSSRKQPKKSRNSQKSREILLEQSFSGPIKKELIKNLFTPLRNLKSEFLGGWTFPPICKNEVEIGSKVLKTAGTRQVSGGNHCPITNTRAEAIKIKSPLLLFGEGLIPINPECTLVHEHVHTADFDNR